MKRKMLTGRITAMILVILGITVFAVFASGIKIDFIENYSYNFKLNILAIGKKMGIEFSEPVREYLEDLPEQTNDVPGQINGDADENDEVSSDETEISEEEDIGEEVDFAEPELENKKIKSKPIALENASSAEFAEYRGYLLCVSPTSIIAFDKNSEVLWTYGIHMNNPILKVNGNYFLIAERGGSKISLFDGKKQLYTAEADGAVKTADISANGDAVITSDKEYYKGSVIVINKNGERIFSWNSGSYPILDADICSGSRRVGISFLNTENGADSVVDIFEIANGNKICETFFESAIAFDVNFLGDVLNVFTDNGVAGLTQKGKIAWESRYDDRKLLSVIAEDKGYKMLLLDNNNSHEIELLTGKGRVKSLLTAETKPEFCDIKSGFVTYGSERELILSTVSGKYKKVYHAPKEIFGIHIIDDNNVAVVYNSGIDFIEFV